MMPRKPAFAATCFVIVCAASTLAKETGNWVSWRGRLGNGSIEQGRYPDKFSAEKFRWRTNLPGQGCSTPIVLDEKIYLTAPVEGSDAVLSYDLELSRILNPLVNTGCPHWCGCGRFVCARSTLGANLDLPMNDESPQTAFNPALAEILYAETKSIVTKRVPSGEEAGVRSVGGEIACRERLGGMLRYYYRKAA